MPTKPEDLPAWNYDGSSTGQVRGRGRWGESSRLPPGAPPPLPAAAACSCFPAFHPPCCILSLPNSPLRPSFLTLLQAPGNDSEVYIVPRRIYKDPFRGGDNIIVMCDCYEPPRVLPDGTVSALKPIPTNTRAACAEVGAPLLLQLHPHLCLSLLPARTPHDCGFRPQLCAAAAHFSPACPALAHPACLFSSPCLPAYACPCLPACR